MVKHQIGGYFSIIQDVRSNVSINIIICRFMLSLTEDEIDVVKQHSVPDVVPDGRIWCHFPRAHAAHNESLLGTAMLCDTEARISARPLWGNLENYCLRRISIQN